jgi:hypothetical protein
VFAPSIKADIDVFSSPNIPPADILTDVEMLPLEPDAGLSQYVYDELQYLHVFVTAIYS